MSDGQADEMDDDRDPHGDGPAGRVIVLELTMIEAVHLARLVGQFLELLQPSAADADFPTVDPAIRRLTPDAYPEDADASRDFRDITENDLLGRRADDASAVLAELDVDADHDVDEKEALTPVIVTLDAEGLRAWMRTLAAVRLVLASRLGIESEDDHDDSDPRFGIYDWLGYRLEGLVAAASTD
jgi:hypothetical protein